MHAIRVPFANGAHSHRLPGFRAQTSMACIQAKFSRSEHEPGALRPNAPRHRRRAQARLQRRRMRRTFAAACGPAGGPAATLRAMPLRRRFRLLQSGRGGGESRCIVSAPSAAAENLM
jgi:hypothetical protein